MYSLPKEPGSIGHTLDAGFKLYSVAFKPVLGLSILAVLSVAVPIFAAVVGITMFSGGEQAPSGGLIAVFVVGILAALSLYLMFYLAAVCRIGGIAYGQNLSFHACVGTGLRRLIPVIVASLLYGLAMFGGFILFIIPGFIVSVSLAYFVFCIVLEGDGILESLRHSHRLVWGNWWRTAIIGTVVLVIYYIVSIAIELPFIVLDQVMFDTEAGDDPGFIQPLLSMTGSILSAIITLPLMASVFVAVFHDLKLRKEGHDLEARVEALTAGA